MNEAQQEYIKAQAVQFALQARLQLMAALDAMRLALKYEREEQIRALIAGIGDSDPVHNGVTSPRKSQYVGVQNAFASILYMFGEMTADEVLEQTGSIPIDAETIAANLDRWVR